MNDRTREIWLLEEKIGKRRGWVTCEFAHYFGADAKRRSRMMASHLTNTTPSRKYRAVRYVPERKVR